MKHLEKLDHQFSKNSTMEADVPLYLSSNNFRNFDINSGSGIKILMLSLKTGKVHHFDTYISLLLRWYKPTLNAISANSIPV